MARDECQTLMPFGADYTSTVRSGFDDCGYIVGLSDKCVPRRSARLGLDVGCRGPQMSILRQGIFFLCGGGWPTGRMTLGAALFALSAKGAVFDSRFRRGRVVAFVFFKGTVVAFC